MAHRKRSKQKKGLTQFSTLSEGTLHSPSLSLCLELVSKLYHRHVILMDGVHESRRDTVWEEKFDVDNFLPKRYDTFMASPLLCIGGPIVFTQQRRRSKVSQPTVKIINTFFIGIFKKLHLGVESSIVSLIYTERLMEKRHISLTNRNWRPILIASILTASKVWDDLSSWNIEFANLLPILSLPNINKLEGIYLQALDYDLYISSSEYARYYFALRGLKNVQTEHIPRYYLDMKIAKTTDPSMDDERSIVEEAKYPPLPGHSEDLTHSLMSDASRISHMSNYNMIMDQLVTSSSESSNHSNPSSHTCIILDKVIKEEEETEKDNDNGLLIIKRSKGIILKPKQLKQTSQLTSFSMPSKIQTLRPIHGSSSVHCIQ
eukprot:66250_1